VRSIFDENFETVCYDLIVRKDIRSEDFILVQYLLKCAIEGREEFERQERKHWGDNAFATEDLLRLNSLVTELYVVTRRIINAR
jgi:hypothetical protein